MIIRHCTVESNVDENLLVIDAKLVRHVTVSNGKIKDMSGLIDPGSHLNLDYPDHKVTKCVIAEKFEEGAKVRINNDGLVFALVLNSFYEHYGVVDYTDRLIKMIEAVKTGRSEGKYVTRIGGNNASIPGIESNNSTNSKIAAAPKEREIHDSQRGNI